MSRLKKDLKKNNKIKEQTKFYDILSIPSTPEDLFTIQYPIGHGAFGTVYKAIHNSTNDVFAVKIIDYSKDNNRENNNIINYNYYSVQQETSLMKKVSNSDYIVKYYGSYFSRKSNTIWLILEYCSSGSAIDLMYSMNRTFSEVEVATIIEMILKGLILMHKENLMHRDIKGANILISEKGFAKLGDFGVGAVLSDEEYRISKKGSPYWMSPQVASNMHYDFKTDIWSLGITCVELLEGEPPFSNLKPNIVMERISKNPPSPKEIINLNEHTPEFKSFLEHCLETDPKKRASASDLLKHEFIKKFSKGRKYLETLVKKYQKDVEKFREESEEEYQKLMEKNKINVDNEEDIYENNFVYNNEFDEIKNNNPYRTYNQNNYDYNLDSFDNKIQLILNNNIENKNKNKGKKMNNNLLAYYTENKNSFDIKSSLSKEMDNIIILDRNITKNKMKENNDEELTKNIIQFIKKDEKNNINQKKISDKSEISGSYFFKSSTSSNSRRDYVEKKDKSDEQMTQNINEENPKTARKKTPKKSVYNENNITIINKKYKMNEENIDDNDDEGHIRESNESLISFKHMEIYKNKA